MFCLIAVVWMLPLLIRWRDGGGGCEPPGEEGGEAAGAPPRRWARLAWEAPIGLVVVAACTVMAFTQLDMVSFEYDLSSLRKAGLSYAELDEDQRAAATSSFAPVVASFETPEALAAAHTRLVRKVDSGELPYVAGVLSVHSVLPVDQSERLARLTSIAGLARQPAMQFLPLAARQNLSALAQHEPRLLTVDDLPHSLRHALGAAQPRPRMLLLPGGNQWDLRENAALKASVAELVPEAEVAGEYLALAVLYELVVDDVPWVAGTAFLVVFLLSWLDLRKLGRAVWTVSALAAGMAWAGAGMVGFDIQLSVVNFVGIPILMGIGVDVIIHLMHRVEEEGPGGVGRAMSTTGWASALSASTTILSFLSLTVAEHQGVRSLGHLIVLGLSLVTLGGFAIVPLGWLTRWRLTGRLRRPED